MATPDRRDRWTPMYSKQAPRSTPQIAIGLGLAFLVVVVAIVVALQRSGPPGVLIIPKGLRLPSTAIEGPAALPRPSPAAQIDAYASPDGDLLGPIPADLAMVYQHSGYPGWSGVDWQGSIVWVKADPPDSAIDLAIHEAPQAAPAPRYAAPAAPQAAPAPPPTVCAVAQVDNVSATACGYDLAALEQQAQADLAAQLGARPLEQVGDPSTPIPDYPTVTAVPPISVR